MKKSMKGLATCLLLLGLTACGGEEEIVYEESAIEIPREYKLSEEDTAPAFFEDVFLYIEGNTVEALTATDEEEGEEEAPAVEVELSKEEEKLLKEEEKRLAAANELWAKELEAENNKLGSIRVIGFNDPAEANAEAISEATLAHEESMADVVAPAPAPEPAEEGGETVEGEESAEAGEGEAGPVETPLSNTVAVEEDPDAYLRDVPQECYIYTYDVSTTGKTGGDATAAYVELMNSSGYKIIDSFHPVDNEYYEMLTPDFTQRAGTVALAKKASGVDRLMLIIVDWHSVGAVVTVDYRDGTLWVAPKKEAAASKGALSIQDAVTYLATRNPSDLGLTGGSMEEYNIYTSEGLVMINGEPYREFTVSQNGASGNVYGGTYLIEGEGNVFQVDQHTGAVAPLNITNVFDTLS